jgi:hypothetical protein
MATPTPIEPSEQELDYARRVHLWCPERPCPNKEKHIRDLATQVASTRCDGLTAAQWKAKFEAEISAEWRKAWLQMKSALAEAQQIAEDARQQWAAAEESLRLADELLQVGRNRNRSWQLKHTAYLASRHPAKPETKTGE